MCAQCRTCGWVTTRYSVPNPINTISPEMEAECHRHSRQPSAPTLDLVAQAA